MFPKYRYKLARQSPALHVKYQEPVELAGDRLDDIDKPSEPDSGLSRFPHNSASLTRSHRVNQQALILKEYIGTVGTPSFSPSDAPCATRLSPPASGPPDSFAE